jgi:hypothetical protein
MKLMQMLSGNAPALTGIEPPDSRPTAPKANRVGISWRNSEEMIRAAKERQRELYGLFPTRVYLFGSENALYAEK